MCIYKYVKREVNLKIMNSGIEIWTEVMVIKLVE